MSLAFTSHASVSASPAPLKIGIIGLDTSHVVQFTRLLNDHAAPDHVPGAVVVAAFKSGSADMPEKSLARIEGFAAELSEKYGVTLCDTIDDVLAQVDAVMIENVDGRKHLEIARAVFPSGKPVFIDKPLAGSLADGMEIMRLADTYHVPCFSASALRFAVAVKKITLAQKTTLRAAMTFSPCEFEPHHPDLFWYGIHGVEMLYAILGAGCESVSRVHAPDGDVVTGRWHDGRLGIFFGYRNANSDYGFKVVGSEGVVSEDFKADYVPLVLEIVRFFRTKHAPVSSEETLEVLAFMEAADESRRLGGAAIPMASMRPTKKNGRETPPSPILTGPPK
jgi:predicted dehydrogenase